MVQTCAAAHSELPPQLIRARKIKQLGLASSTALLGTGLAFLVANAQLPVISERLWQSLSPWAAASILSTVALAACKAKKDGLEIEVHNGRLYLQWNLPPKDGPQVEEGAIVVRSF